MASFMQWIFGEGRDKSIDENPPEVVNNGEETFLCHFRGFKDLPAVPGYSVASSRFMFCGHEWYLRIHPGGQDASPEGKMCVYLVHCSEEPICIRFNVSIRNIFGQQIGLTQTTKAFKKNDSCWGFNNWVPRSVAIGMIGGSCLDVFVGMKHVQIDDKTFIPPNPYCKVLNKFLEEKSADVMFEVGDEQLVRKTRKRAKTTTTFHAHHLILKECASILGDLCSPGGSDVTIVPITDVKPEIFRHLLYYIYGGKVSEEDLKENAKDIIDAADRYGVVGLKLEAEASFVISTTITFDNAIEYLLYADSVNCALIKEAVMDFILKNHRKAQEKLSFENVPATAMKDLLAAVSRSRGKAKGITSIVDFSSMRVSTMRKMLHEKGLDIDGSREMMIARLKEAS